MALPPQVLQAGLGLVSGGGPDGGLGSGIGGVLGGFGGSSSAEGGDVSANRTSNVSTGGGLDFDDPGVYIMAGLALVGVVLLTREKPRRRKRRKK